MEEIFVINGYEVCASYEHSEIDSLFLPLLELLRNKQKDKKGRILVFLAAPPGVGKTTLSMFLQALSRADGEKCIQAIGMDGFHHYQSYLSSHTMFRNNKDVPMLSLKGCPETFDYEKLKNKIIELTMQDTVKWPLYVRSLHNPVEDQCSVTSDIVLLEGNYLLLEDEKWRELKQYCDFSIFISTEVEYLKERLIQRKMMGGVSREEAEAFVKRSDLYNVEYVLKHSQKADITYQMDKDGRYHKVNL